MTKRIRSFNRRSRRNLTSPFIIFCGAVAILYLVARIMMIIYPVSVLGFNALRPVHNDHIVCSQRESPRLHDPASVLSVSYQQHIKQQKSLSSNLITNSDINIIDPSNGQPIGYTHNIEDGTGKYEYLYDSSENKHYLHVDDLGISSDTTRLTPLWLVRPVDVAPGKTYAYSFQYRSNVPVLVTLEYSKPGTDTIESVSVVTLKSSEAWQDLAAHFDNTEGATSFRIIVSGVNAGYVDTRDFNVHQINDAGLTRGAISVTFDDGWKSIYSGAFDLLNKYHIRSTQYIISDVAKNEVTGYMDINTLKKMKDSDHEIGSHSLSHCNQTKLTLSDTSDDAHRSRQGLEQSGLGPIRSFAYPFGQYTDATQNVYSREYSYIRTSDYGYNDRYFDRANIRSMQILDETTDAQVEAWVEYAKLHHLWLVLVYHRVDETGEYSVARSQLDRHLKAISESGLEILPLAEVADGIDKNYER